MKQISKYIKVVNGTLLAGGLLLTACTLIAGRFLFISIAVVRENKRMYFSIIRIKKETANDWRII